MSRLDAGLFAALHRDLRPVCPDRGFPMNADDFDPGLFGAWGRDGYCGSAAPSPAEMTPSRRSPAESLPARDETVHALMLEVKSAEAAGSGADLSDVLNTVTEELKAQLVLFANMRSAAQKALDDPDADQKLARADLKASSDAISVTVRTLEKIDELQRKIIDAREEMAERTISDADLAALSDRLDAHIESRAQALAARHIGLAGSEEGPRRADDAPG
jgi:hypothetical protein